MGRILNWIRKNEFAKRLLMFIEVLLLLTFMLVIVALLRGFENGLVAWITGIFSLATIAVGFYYWKAKNENIRKYSKLSSEEIEKISKVYDQIFKGGDHFDDSETF